MDEEWLAMLRAASQDGKWNGFAFSDVCVHFLHTDTQKTQNSLWAWNAVKWYFWTKALKIMLAQRFWGIGIQKDCFPRFCCGITCFFCAFWYVLRIHVSTKQLPPPDVQNLPISMHQRQLHSAGSPAPMHSWRSTHVQEGAKKSAFCHSRFICLHQYSIHHQH